MLKKKYEGKIDRVEKEKLNPRQVTILMNKRGKREKERVREGKRERETKKETKRERQYGTGGS